MIPLTPEAREGLMRMVAVIDCADPARRDPCVTAAMAWIESLPSGPILSLEIGGTCKCDTCPFEHGALVCVAKRLLGVERCPLEGGGVLVTGAES